MGYFLITETNAWRYFGVAIPAGMMAGLFFYVTIAAFLHPDFRPDPQDVPRQLLIIAILATIAAHFVEIHFGIAIAATRTYFWIETATLLVLGLRLAQPAAFSATQSLITVEEDSEEVMEEEPPATKVDTRKKSVRKGRSTSARRTVQSVNSGGLPSTFMTDLLVFLTFVFIYSTNSTQVRNGVTVLFNSILRRVEGGELISSPAVFFLMVFVWLISATVGLAAEALSQPLAPSRAWWIKNYLMHTIIIWSGWLVYGLIQGGRLVPGAGGQTLDDQLGHVAGHFALYTWIVIIWIGAAGTIYAWPYLQERTLAFAKRPAVSLVAAVLAAIFVFGVVSSVNVALVRADIIYKQGQQFDNQRNWVSSIELYRRALAARKTEDHYMLFLGRALLEQAKAAGEVGAYQFPPTVTVDDVLALTPEQVQQMSRTDLLRAAEAVLLEAQRINPLNTDHTANLSRLYRTWADLSSDTAVKQTMLDKSIAEYNMAVQLSPNAAHLWNEKGNAHLARGEDDLAEAAYRHSLSLDPLFEQSYLLLADFYDRRQEYQQVVDLLEGGIEAMAASSRFRPTAQMYSFLGVAYARLNDLPSAIAVNQKVLELQPNNVVAMRNLALLYRDHNEPEQALAVLEQAFALLGPEQANDIRQLRQLAVQIYQGQGNTAKVIEQYEAIRQMIPDDLETLKALSNLYNTLQDDRKVVEIAQSLIGAEPNNYQHPLNIAQALERAGQIENARQFAEQALALAPAEQKPAIETLIAGLAADQ
jgi:tetratricopeptide (TPR) repeat protein